ncbi:MAG: xanthine dehydrogenase family protein subunit M, partial [Mesorhizobium sp.]
MRYIRPLSIEDAVGELAKAVGPAAILAGGSDLLVRMKGGFIEPELIVDIKRIGGLADITETADGFRIGAAVPCAVLGENKAVRKAWPGADSVPALVAAGAKAVVAGPSGKRTIAVESVPTGPGRTSLAKGEIIEAILLDKRPEHAGDAYLRF